ncbi:hypothetical protein M434DRAFT_398187 [Hypoxylon sp. CO27-5]|nr:hypothetical protein M434DRAFT_398187 [Hypoxylon sp. CO27-5]
MPPSRRSFRRSLKDVKDRVKRRKQSFKQSTELSDNATRVVSEQAPEPVVHQTAEQLRKAEIPRELPGSQYEPLEQEVALAEEEILTVTQLLGAEPHASSDRTPIWIRSKERFQKERPELYEMIQPLFGDIQNLAVDDWDTWLNKPREESNSTWFRRCKAYLPQLKSFKTVALSLSNLDPHKIAPWVISGIFLAAELCFETADPLTRDKAMSTILKANIIVVKWLDSEPDLKLMKERNGSLDIISIERRLEALYFDSLDLMFTIYKSGKTRGSRANAVLAADLQEWERKCNLLDRQNSTCVELKSRAEAELKKLEDVLKWIRPGSEDPEPAHQTIKERTGVDDPESNAGRWLLETGKFRSWIEKVCENKAVKSAFWLKGSMGTGKTTLMCRIISHFEELPVSGVRFLQYYCFGSQAGTESKTPTYEIILRALCHQLAWNIKGGVAEPAKSLYDNLEVKGKRNEPLTKKRLEKLLKSLLEYSRSTVTSTVFVIDALDECKSKDDSKKLLTFLRRLQKELGCLYFLISSRPHVNVGDHFEGSVQVFNPIQPQTKEEMANFIKSQIDSKRRDIEWRKSIFIRDDSLCKRLESALIKSAGGMFRWVQIWLSIFFPRNKTVIRRLTYAEDLLKDLENPQSLGKLKDGEDESVDETKKIEEAYRRLWNIIDDQYKKHQIRLFQVIMGAFERLSTEQLLEAISFDPDNPDNYEKLELDELEGLYCNFLRRNIHGDLYFEHISARIFISEMKTEGSNKLIFSQNENHRTLADIAVKTIERPKHFIWKAAEIPLADWGRHIKTYLEIEKTFPPGVLVPQRLTSGSYSNHFGNYIFRYWIDHCGVFRRNEQFVRRICKFIQDAQYSLEAWALYNPSLWHCKSIFNAMTLISTYQNKEIMCMSPLLCMIGLNFSPFYYDNGPGPALLPGLDDITTQNWRGQTALHIACALGNVSIVEDLLKFERAQRQSCYSLLFSNDCLGKVLMHESTNDNVVKILLKYEMLESHQPAAGGLRISKLLDYEDERGETPLKNITRWCSDDYLEQMFVKYHVGPAQPLDDILWNATKCRKIKAVRLLIQNKANTSAKENSDMTSNDPPLHIAITNRDLEMIDLLLHWGEGMKTVSDTYGPAICTAAASRDTDVVQYLLDQGAKINDVGKEFGTALGVAALFGDISMAKFLLRKGADINAKGGEYETPLGVARAFAKKGMVKFLIDNGALIGLLSEEHKRKVEMAM